MMVNRHDNRVEPDGCFISHPSLLFSSYIFVGNQIVLFSSLSTKNGYYFKTTFIIFLSSLKLKLILDIIKLNKS